MVTKWTIGGNTFELNPSEDTGWIAESVETLQHPAGAAYDIVQAGGTHSAVRVIRGLTKSKTLRDAIEAMKGTVVAYSDHYAASGTAYVQRFRSDMVLDISNMGSGQGTFRYELTLVKIT